MPIIWTDIKHFKPEDFDSPDAPESGKVKMDLFFVKTLDIIRDTIKKPLKITSGYRTESHNKAIHGANNSAHLRGLAADLFVGGDSQLRFLIIKVAISLGINRFEDAPSHIHLDADRSLTQNIFVHLKSYPTL